MNTVTSSTEQNSVNLYAGEQLAVDAAATSYTFLRDMMCKIRVQLGNAANPLTAGARVQVDIYLQPDTGDECYIGSYALQLPAAKTMTLLDIPAFFVETSDILKVWAYSSESGDTSEGAKVWIHDVSDNDTIDRMDADFFTDTGENPYHIVKHKKGDVSTIYTTKNIFDIANGNITDTTTPVAKIVEE